MANRSRESRLLTGHPLDESRYNHNELSFVFASEWDSVRATNGPPSLFSLQDGISGQSENFSNWQLIRRFAG
ncbi:hypothetical protein RESH_03167 [Rhodopirellula europaea SH398]|uniref:Uncharacterized protein n=1 Tax=Rhodopirellula europaea SH398 TaxID=1263868 RepID=M5S4I1_9BACT|nr:hypothetical protein RESH_03167 [Rhodopirellula europaea SH398]